MGKYWDSLDDKINVCTQTRKGTILNSNPVSKTIRCHVQFGSDNSCDDGRAVFSLDNIGGVQREDVLHEQPPNSH